MRNKKTDITFKWWALIIISMGMGMVIGAAMMFIFLALIFSAI